MLDFRGGRAVRDFVDGAELERYGLAGVATPDHTIRTKNYPLILPSPEPGHLDRFAIETRQAVERFVTDYRAYFARHNAASAGDKRELDPMPRVVLVPGQGLFGLGRSAKDAAIVADIAESWIETVTGAEAVGRFESLSEAELFEMEYWSLEQAKLGRAEEKPLFGQIALITGGAGTIGFATAETMRPGHPDSVLPYTTPSMTIFIGHGWRTSAIVSPAAARNASDSAAQCGRSRRLVTEDIIGSGRSSWFR